MASPGYPIVLTADRTLTARYHLLFDSLMATDVSTAMPGFMVNVMTPRAWSLDNRAPRAPFGLRRVEASLLSSGVPINDLAVVEEAHLGSAIGPKTMAKIATISAANAVVSPQTCVARLC